nr:MAG TPA: hypothetical protein [Caudoviricetes sp.]
MTVQTGSSSYINRRVAKLYMLPYKVLQSLRILVYFLFHITK